MAGEKDRVDAYMQTVARLEPEIAHTDQSAWGTSIAVSLKRIADHMCGAEQRRVSATAEGPLTAPATSDDPLFDAVEAALRYALGHNLIEKHSVSELIVELQRRGVALHLVPGLQPGGATWIDDGAKQAVMSAMPPWFALAREGFEVKRKDGTSR